MHQVHTVTPKLDICVIESIEPKILIQRSDTRTKTILKPNAWYALFRFQNELTSFFDGKIPRYHIWLPVKERIKLECFVNSKDERLIDLRYYERGSGSRYFLNFSTSEGFSLNKTGWQTLIDLKPLIDEDLKAKGIAVCRMRELILNELTTTLFDVTSTCANVECRKQICHSQSCSEFDTNFSDRVERNLHEALPQLDREKILHQFETEHGWIEDQEDIYAYFVNSFADLKNALIYGY